jgi:hypothetical protein
MGRSFGVVLLVRSRLRGLARTFKVSRTSVTAWIKKSSALATACCDPAAGGQLGALAPDLGIG